MKEVLQITITRGKQPKTQIGKWLFWKIYWPIWKIQRPKLLSKFYYGLSNFILYLLPKKEREKQLKEFEDFDIVIRDKTNVSSETIIELK
jgi:hypothetical protein